MTFASIIVPAFNVADTLPQTLDALLAQSWRDFEIIVVDDGSTDATVQVVKSYSHDRRLRLISQANRGLAGARNTGIYAAKGEVIGFCDADDLWEPTKLAEHIWHLRENPHVGVSYSGSLLIDDEGQPTGHAQRPRLNRVSAAHVFKRNPVGNGSAPVIRRAALADVSYMPPSESERPWYFDETFRQSEDIEMWLRMALVTDWAFEGVPGLLTRYRVNSGGLSAATDRQLEAWERMVAKLTPLAPEFFARHTREARAYQLRYLSRRAIVDMDRGRTLTLTRRWLEQSKLPLIKEPVKSTATLAAAAVLALCGEGSLRRLMQLASKFNRAGGQA